MHLVAVVMAITFAQDTTPRPDTVQVPPPAPAPVVSPPPTPTIEQIRYQDGLRTVTRGVAQVRDGLGRVARAQQSDSVARRRAARFLGGLCASGRTFIATGRPKMQPTAYTDTLRVFAKQLTVRLDSLSRALPNCEKTAGREPTVVTADLTKRLQAYDDALLAFRNALAAQTKPDSTKTVSQQ